MWPWKHKKEDEAFYHFFKNILGFTPRNTRVYQIAFIHRSQSEETMQGRRINNERLEYLGDAVLGAIVAEYLYKKFPSAGEGFLTETRSKIVSRASLGRLAKRIGLHDLIKYNRESQGVFKSMEGDAFEALVGAIYLEKGYKFTRRVIINRVLQLYVDVEELTQTVVNHKGLMIDWAQKHRKRLTFKVLQVIPIDNGARRQYEVELYLSGQPITTAIDYTIKSAEQRASEKAYAIVTQPKAQEENSATTEQPLKEEETKDVATDEAAITDETTVTEKADTTDEATTIDEDIVTAKDTATESPEQVAAPPEESDNQSE